MGEGTRRVRGLQVEVSAGDQDKIEAEFGDVLFSMINYARFFECKPEDAGNAPTKFIKRFQYLESKSR
jgi:XTP/dITP diphosphohydrolase